MWAGGLSTGAVRPVLCHRTVPPRRAMPCLDCAYQPYDDSVVAHLGGGVQWGHAVISARVGVSPTILHQVLDDLQVAFLAGEVQRGGPCFGLGTQRAASGAQCPSPTATASQDGGHMGRRDTQDTRDTQGTHWPGAGRAALGLRIVAPWAAWAGWAGSHPPLSSPLGPCAAAATAAGGH